MLEITINYIKEVMTKKDIKTYLIGGIIFTISYDFIWLFVMGIFKSTGNGAIQFVFEILFSLYAIAIIKTNNCITSVFIYIYLFLLGGLLSLLFSYNYYFRQARNNKEMVNPISKKSLFVAIAVLVGFVLIVRSIAWIGGF